MHDLNPMDYAMWDSLSETVYAGRTEKFTEQELKEKIQEKWAEISLAEIRKSIGTWKKRLRHVCGQDGGHIDHLLQ
jgi:ABC-type sulfate transport system substrate-binding protein